MDRKGAGFILLLIASTMADSSVLAIPLALVVLAAWLVLAGGGADV